MFLPEKTVSQLYLGVSISIPSPAREQIEALRKSCTHPDNPSSEASLFFIAPHLTILPPHPVENQQVGEIINTISKLSKNFSPFQVQLRGSNTFLPTSPVTYVALARGVDECAELEGCLRKAGLGAQKRFDFIPHVTIAQDSSGEILNRLCSQAADFFADFTVLSLNIDQILGPDNSQRLAKVDLGSGLVHFTHALIAEPASE